MSPSCSRCSRTIALKNSTTQGGIEQRIELKIGRQLQELAELDACLGRLVDEQVGHAQHAVGLQRLVLCLEPQVRVEEGVDQRHGALVLATEEGRPPGRTPGRVRRQAGRR